MGICLAASGHLYPAIAAVLMTVSSFLVITNSLRLSHYDRESNTPEGAVQPTVEPSGESIVDSSHVATVPVVAVGQQRIQRESVHQEPIRPEPIRQETVQ